MKEKRIARIARRWLCLTLLAFALPGKGQGISIYTTLPQLGPGPSLVMVLAGNNLTAVFGSSGYWLASVHFPATATDPAADLQIVGPIVSVFPPSDGFPASESIMYQGSFLLSDGQKQLLLTGQAQLVLTEDAFSPDPAFRPQVVSGALLDYVVAPLAAPQIVRPGNLRLNWQSQVGQAYVVQFKDTLNAPSWTNSGTTVIATATDSSVDVPIAAAAGFYRVIQVH